MKLGIVGWRGMVGSVLLGRMVEEGDFRGLDARFFSTSQAGQPGPDVGLPLKPLGDAGDIDALCELDAILTCQGSDYTRSIHPKLRSRGWNGYWIDAASALRMEENSIIVLDPLNRQLIDTGLRDGVKDYIGGNCTVSLMLLATSGLYKKGWVQWISAMTYQSASGAGAKHMKELVNQMAYLGDRGKTISEDPASAVLELDQTISSAVMDSGFPRDSFGVPLAANLLPWIDSPMESGQTREEWKGHVESNKILGLNPEIPVDGQCVRVGAMRCHSQGLTIRLGRDVSLEDIEDAIREGNDWVRLVPNDKESTLRHLTPAAVTGTLDIAVGRIRKLNLGAEYVTLFTVGDQLLWGAAEPVRRMLNILRDRL